MEEQPQDEAHEAPEEDEAVLHDDEPSAPEVTPPPLPQNEYIEGDEDDDFTYMTPRQMIERQQMAYQFAAHNAYRILDAGDLSEDQLTSLGALFQACHQGGETTAAMLEGIIKGILHSKFGFCLACGTNHQAELLGKGDHA